LTQEKLPGADDRRAFDQEYAKKLGLVDQQGALRGEFAKFLAPYQSHIKQLADKSSDPKGQPLKTTLRVLMGGQQYARRDTVLLRHALQHRRIARIPRPTLETHCPSPADC
jgi:hypothetical protein